MKKKFLSLLLLVCIALGALTGCLGGGEEEGQKIDYVAQATLDIGSSQTQKLEANMSQYTHIDGDTTHFRGLTGDNVPEKVESDRVLKARYLAVNTPESTGEIEEWGKAASKFTKSKLASATSIYLESDGAEWATDSNGRFLVWVWYKPEGSDVYRNLNLELLQEGLALLANATDTRYGDIALKASTQAQNLGLYVFSKVKDPDFFYGAAIETDLKTIRTNLEYFSGKRVAITATVTVFYSKGSIYIEDLDNIDPETGMYYGMPVFYGMGNISWQKILAEGNKVYIVGEVSYSENYGYQICNLKYNPMRPDSIENIKVIGDPGTSLPMYRETTLDEFLGKVTVDTKVVDEETGSFTYDEGEEAWVTAPKEFDFAALSLSTSLSMKNLKVKRTYTTNNGGDNDGAISLYCEDENGRKITVRTAVLKDANGNIVESSLFSGKTIDVKGIVDYYNSGNLDEDESPYQIKVFNLEHITIH